MGKTGSIQWQQVKGVKGQIRLVPRQDGEYKKPGPNQRFKSLHFLHRQEAQDQKMGGRRPSGGRGGRRPSQGRGRGADQGRENNSLNRRRMHRPKVAMLGAKQKSSR